MSCSQGVAVHNLCRPGLQRRCGQSVSMGEQLRVSRLSSGLTVSNTRIRTKPLRSGKGESQGRGFVSRLLSLPLRLLPFACLAMNIAITVLLMLSSRRNYPGGEAMHVFHSLLPSGSQEYGWCPHK